jgi:hypothetical protein
MKEIRWLSRHASAALPPDGDMKLIKCLHVLGVHKNPNIEATPCCLPASIGFHPHCIEVDLENTKKN